MNKLKEIKRLVDETVALDLVDSDSKRYIDGIEAGRKELAEEILEILNGEEK